MEPNFHKSEQTKFSDIIEHSSNVEIKNTTPFNKTRKNAKDYKPLFYFNQLAVLGVVTVAIFATLLLIAKENNFCFFSSCNQLPSQSPIAYNFWSTAGALGAFGVLALMGVSVPVAILGC